MHAGDEMIVPHTLLNAQTLNSLIEDFVTRNGAIHGHADVALKEMTDAVRQQLENGGAQIFYDEQEQNWTLVVKQG